MKKQLAIAALSILFTGLGVSPAAAVVFGGKGNYAVNCQSLDETDKFSGEIAMASTGPNDITTIRLIGNGDELTFNHIPGTETYRVDPTNKIGSVWITDGAFNILRDVDESMSKKLFCVLR